MRATYAIDFAVPKAAPAREEAWDVVLGYGDFSVHTRVEAKSHLAALDLAHERNRRTNPTLPALYRSGTATRVHGKAKRQEAYA